MHENLSNGFSLRPRIFIPLIVMIGLCAALLGGCTQDDVKTATPEKVVFAVSNTPLSALILLAQREGLFAREELDLTLVTTPYGKDALALMLAGKADLSAATSVPIVAAILNGAKPTLLATLSKSEKHNALVARKGQGIAESADLAGKRVGATFHTSAHIYLHNLLVEAGVPKEKVSIVDTAPTAAVRKLADGTLDAAVQFAPWQDRSARVAKGRVVMVETPHLYTTHWILAADRNFVQKRPTAARKIIRALLAAQKLAAERPERLIAAMTDVLEMSEPETAQLLTYYKNEIQLPQSMIVALENEARWYGALHAGNKTTPPTPNFLDYIDSSPLKSIRPEAVKFTE